MQKKSTKVYWFLIAGPFLALVLTSFLQIAVRFIVSGSGAGGDGISVFINIFSFLIGIAAVICILLLPLWIVLLIRANDYNKRVSLQRTHTTPDQPPVRPEV